MIKTFCDICGKETGEHERIKLNSVLSKETTINIEIITGINGAWNQGAFHHKCIAKVLANFFRISKGK